MLKVKVTQGILEGESVENEYGGSYLSFKGIPYAEPPIGDLRLKAPSPPKPWDGVRSAKEFGSSSRQFNLLTKSFEGSEDCLYLNVYTPNLRPVRPLPVMVWIHGGGFITGNGNDDVYGPEFLVRHEVIVVTFNYRLDALGFLCLDTEDVPGNAGMKDQVAALRWVKNNIRYFGGDPGNITIFGESAGGVSVAFHLISPMSKGLFKRAIAQSGTTNCWWAQPYEPRERALKLAKELGCHSENDKELYELFKRAPIEWLLTRKIPITSTELAKEYSYPCIGITSEKKFGNNERFFYDDVNDTLRNKVHEGVEVIFGYTEDEGVFGLFNLNLERVIEQLNTFEDYLVPTPIALNCTSQEQIGVGKSLKNFYFGQDKISKDHLDKLFKYFKMEMFVFGIIQLSKSCAKSKRNVFLYKFGCKSERNIFSSIYGLSSLIENKVVVCHGDDLPYIFPFKSYTAKVDKNSDTFKLIDNVTKLWANFAKYGNPTPDGSLGIRWSPYSLEKQEYLDLSNEIKLVTEPEKEDVAFWEELYNKYHPKYLHN